MWKGDLIGGFSVKALRHLIEEKSSERRVEGDRGEPMSWLKSIPKKINIFNRREKLGRLPSRLVLDKIGIDLDSILCPRCDREVESIDHALFFCEKVKLLWNRIGRWWEIEVFPVNSMEDLIEKGGHRAQMQRDVQGGRRQFDVWHTLYGLTRTRWCSNKLTERWQSLFLKFKEECQNGSTIGTRNYKWIGVHGSQIRSMHKNGRMGRNSETIGLKISDRVRPVKF